MSNQLSQLRASSSWRWLIEPFSVRESTQTSCKADLPTSVVLMAVGRWSRSISARWEIALPGGVGAGLSAKHVVLEVRGNFCPHRTHKRSPAGAQLPNTEGDNFLPHLLLLISSQSVEARAQFTAELSDSQSTHTSSFRVLDKTHTIQQDFPKILCKTQSQHNPLMLSRTWLLDEPRVLSPQQYLVHE